MSAITVDFAQLRHEVEQFLYYEARLLDDENYGAWLELLTDDFRYWVPGVENRSRKDPLGSTPRHHMAYFDDTKMDLARRVKRFTSDTAWSENPPTKQFHAITNIELVPTEAADELTVHSLTTVYRGRYEGTGDILYGRREDLLRRVDAELRLANRQVVISHNILQSKNLNTFL
jgi:ethylbenzene dioxygenase beta subunit